MPSVFGFLKLLFKVLIGFKELWEFLWSRWESPVALLSELEPFEDLRDKNESEKKREREKNQGGWSCARLFWQIVDRLKLDAKIRVIDLREREKKFSLCAMFFCICLPKRLCIDKSDKNR